jgi:glycosyltransferase involved in cell wall biosynthesis
LPKLLVSVVIPCYNEEAVITSTLNRINDVVNNLTAYEFELIVVNDGSSDSTRAIVQDIVECDKGIKLLNLTRNFGHQIAVSAGLAKSSGAAAVVIDSDLQDPPEVIEEFLRQWQNGFDVVYGVRANRLGESRFKRISAWLFYRLLNKMTDLEIPPDAGDFRLISRRVINAINSFPEKTRYLRGLISWTGYRSIGVSYVREPRFAGETKYPLKSMLRLARQAVFSFSNKPMELVITSGSLIALSSLLASAWFAVSQLFLGVAVPGWTGLIVAITFLGGIQILAIGIVGSYVGQIFNEVKGRPLFVIDSELGFDSVGK